MLFHQLLNELADGGASFCSRDLDLEVNVLPDVGGKSYIPHRNLPRTPLGDFLATTGVADAYPLWRVLRGILGRYI